MFKSLVCFYLATFGEASPQGRRPMFGDPCQEDPNACKLAECWYVCGDSARPKGMGAMVPPDPAGYSTYNSVSGKLGTISGGERNFLSGRLGTISGGKDNSGSGNLSAVGGGENNKADGGESVISGGKNNVASGDGSVVPGGKCNTAGHKNSMAFGGMDSESGDCISDGAKSCTTDSDGQVKFCNPKTSFEGSVAVGNVSISNTTIEGIEYLVIGGESPMENRTIVTKDSMISPKMESDSFKIRPRLFIGRRIQEIDLVYPTEINADKMVSPKIETGQVETEKVLSKSIDLAERLVVGTENKTEITKDSIRAPKMESDSFKIRPRPLSGRRIQEIDLAYPTEINADRMISPKVETGKVESKSIDLAERLVVGTDNKTEITKDSIRAPRFEVSERLVVGTDSKTEITKDFIKAPEFEATAIKLRPRVIGRKLSAAIYTDINLNNIQTDSITANNIQVSSINGIPITFLFGIFMGVTVFNTVLIILLCIVVGQRQHKSYPKRFNNELVTAKI